MFTDEEESSVLAFFKSSLQEMCNKSTAKRRGGAVLRDVRVINQ